MLDPLFFSMPLLLCGDRWRLLLLQDFATVDDARVLMESEARWQLQMSGHQLLLDYSHGAPASRSGGSQSAELQPALDWICDMCNAVNFAR
jgi:RNA-binding protein 5/10